MKICCFQLLKLIRGIKYQYPSRTFTIRCYLYQNYYDILNISPKSSTKEIKDAYIKLSKQYHPDVNRDDPKCHEKFVQIQNAYQTLSNASSKVKYDNTLNPTGKPFYSSSGSHYDGNPYSWESFSRKSANHQGFGGSNSYESWTRYNEYIAEKMRREAQYRRTRKAQEEYLNEMQKKTGEWLFWGFFIVLGLAFLHGMLTSTPFRNADFYRDMQRMDMERDMRIHREIRREMERQSPGYQSNPDNMKINERSS